MADNYLAQFLTTENYNKTEPLKPNWKENDFLRNKQSKKYILT